MKEKKNTATSQQAFTLILMSATVAMLGTVVGSTMGSMAVSISCVVVAVILLGFGSYIWRRSRS